MSRTIRAHFDGKVIVPDEPVEWPVDQPMEVELRSLVRTEETVHQQLTKEERKERLARLAGRIKGPSIPLEELRRENLYEERV